MNFGGINLLSVKTLKKNQNLTVFDKKYPKRHDFWVRRHMKSSRIFRQKSPKIRRPAQRHKFRSKDLSKVA